MYSPSFSFLTRVELILNKIITIAWIVHYLSDSQQQPMSFFPLQPRDIDKLNTRSSKVGPGQYHSEEKETKRQNYAPFGSLAMKKNKNQKQLALGPGQYDINQPIIHPSICKYQNRNIIIVKINDDGGHQFKSRSNRFQQTKPSDIGPGTYQTNIMKRKTKSNSLKRPNIAERIRQINRDYYKKHRQVTLLSDLPVPDNGNEEATSENKKTKGVVDWGLNKRERFTIDIKQENQSQEKERALSDMIISRNRKIRPSAVFVSKTMKSHIEAQIYKTNNSFKADLRKMIDFKDDHPGPGAYELNHNKSEQTPKRFQFFGSTVERFPENKFEETIGPGSYKVSEKQQQSLKPDNFLSFEKLEKEERHSYIPNCLQNPGPGSYNVNQTSLRLSTSEKQLKKPFGSCQPRFPHGKDQQRNTTDSNFQMIAFYRQKQMRKEEELKMRKIMLEHHGSPAFVSGSKRFQRQKEDQVDIGSYDITQTDISTRMARYQQMVRQLEECQLKKPPFLSSDERFKAEKNQENQHVDCWCLVKSVQKQMLEHQSPAFVCGERRQLFESKAGGPPVGHYENSGKGMIKDSFNSRFRKKAENQVKRSSKLNYQGTSNSNNKVSILGNGSKI